MWVKLSSKNNEKNVGWRERIEGMGNRREGQGDSRERTRAGAWRRKG